MKKFKKLFAKDVSKKLETDFVVYSKAAKAFDRQYGPNFKYIDYLNVKVYVAILFYSNIR